MATRHPAPEPVRIVGECSALKRELALLREFAQSNAPVHVYGETGTGKELVARSLHLSSQRAAQRFIAQNCAALSETLLQSTLFGHRRGAFTGAERDQIGLFEAAHKGTLFLDEISEMTPLVQGAVLRVLQDGEFSRLGECETRKTDVRIVSASNARLQEAVSARRFRQDLYFRITTLSIEMPPLRHRGSDVILLARLFLTQFNNRTGKAIAGFQPEVHDVLAAYPWPGNVRQLQSEIERACILTPTGGSISLAALSPALTGVSCHPIDDGMTTTEETRRCRTLPDVMGETERSLLIDALGRAKGNRTRAAQLLGVSRQRLSQRLRHWNLSPSR